MCALHDTLCTALKFQLSPSVCKAAVQGCYLRIFMSVKYDATIDAARAQFFFLGSLFACWLTMARCSRRLLGCEQSTIAPQQ
jgi:hypothetical protein